MKTIELRHARSNAGFSLVELLVGLVIGMIGVIVMMQIFSVSEGYKRTTTGGDDAQNNGAIGLYGLQRDLRMAGADSNSFTDNAASSAAYSLISCNVTLRTGVTINALGPVTINHPNIPAGDANTDTVLIYYGTSIDAPEGDRIASQSATNIYRMDAFLVGSGTPSIRVGDRVVALPTPRPTPCNLSLDSVTALAGSDVTVAAGVAGMTNGALFNLGQAPRFLAYAVRGRNLTMCDLMDTTKDCTSSAAANWITVASNVVGLRAQYGQDTTAGTMDGTVDLFNQTTPTNVCGWVRMRAVRLALVARSAQLERVDSSGNHATPNAPTWAGSAASPTGSSVNAIDLSADTTWQDYRYKVFETVVPLRNLAWLGVQAGC